MWSLNKVRNIIKYQVIQYFYEQRGCSIKWLCTILGVSRAAYYKWKHRGIPEYEKENYEIAQLIKEYNERFKGILGYRRMTDWINHFNGTHYNSKKIHRIMKALKIHSVIRRKRPKYYPVKPEYISQNILKRNFIATKPNEKWSTDVTEFKIPGSTKKLYLSAIIDLYDRSIVSYAVSLKNNNTLVFNTFDLAIKNNPDAKPLFHSDRGFQYTSKLFQEKLINQGMISSMSRVGRCIDNGPTEGLWGIIKTEMQYMYEYYDEKSLRYSIDKYINFYNTERPQKRFNLKTPIEVRTEALSTNTPQQYPIPVNKRIIKYKAKFTA